MATALVTQIAYAVQTLFDPAGTAGRLIDLGKLANYGLLGGSAPTVWLPSELFTTGVNGAWYDPSDLNTLFQDAAGTTPVTAVEQPVGLMLDKSKGLVLGPELVTNGDFSQGTTGWSVSGTGAQISVAGGIATVANGSANEASLLLPALTAGKWYFLSADISAVNGTSSIYFVPPSGSQISNIPKTTAGKLQGYFYSGTTGTGSRIAVGNATAGAYFSIDNISVRELQGNHAFNSSGNSANFPVLSARYNLLTKTEAINTSPWGGNATPSQTAAPDSTNTATTLTVTATDTDYSWEQGFSIATGAQCSATLLVKKTSDAITFPMFYLFQGSTFGIVALNTNNGVMYDRPGYPADSKSSVSSGDYWKITFSKTLPAGSCAFRIFPAATQDFVTYARYIGGCTIWHPDVRVANDALNQPAYQRVNTSSDYDTVGFKPYLKFNGTNQWLQTNSIGFTNTAQMFVCAGVRKLSDYTSQSNAMVMLELGPQVDLNNGSWALVGSIGYSTGIKYNFDSKGTTAFVSTNTTSASYAAPITSIVSGVSDLGGSPNDYAKLRINGSQISENITTQGNGPFGTYPLYIGARAGTSYWFNGRLYQMVVAGKQVSADEITNTEAFTNQKTGAY